VGGGLTTLAPWLLELLGGGEKTLPALYKIFQPTAKNNSAAGKTSPLTSATKTVYNVGSFITFHFTFRHDEFHSSLSRKGGKAEIATNLLIVGYYI
jgi:hypothetical protein